MAQRRVSQSQLAIVFDAHRAKDGISHISSDVIIRGHKRVITHPSLSDESPLQLSVDVTEVSLPPANVRANVQPLDMTLKKQKDVGLEQAQFCALNADVDDIDVSISIRVSISISVTVSEGIT